MNKMNKKGFTLIEMLVVIAIIAVLVAIIVPTVASSTMKAKGAADAANMRSMAAEAAIEYMNKDGATSGTTITMSMSSKVFGTSGTLTFKADASGSLVGSWTDSTHTMSLNDFVYVAENGKTK